MLCPLHWSCLCETAWHAHALGGNCPRFRCFSKGSVYRMRVAAPLHACRCWMRRHRIRPSLSSLSSSFSPPPSPHSSPSLPIPLPYPSPSSIFSISSASRLRLSPHPPLSLPPPPSSPPAFLSPRLPLPSPSSSPPSLYPHPFLPIPFSPSPSPHPLLPLPFSPFPFFPILLPAHSSRTASRASPRLPVSCPYLFPATEY